MYFNDGFHSNTQKVSGHAKTFQGVMPPWDMGYPASALNLPFRCLDNQHKLLSLYQQYKHYHELDLKAKHCQVQQCRCQRRLSNHTDCCQDRRRHRTLPFESRWKTVWFVFTFLWNTTGKIGLERTFIVSYSEQSAFVQGPVNPGSHPVRAG